MLELQKLDKYIVLLMLALLPMDMINSIMLKNEIILPITLGQLFKLIIIAVLFFRFYLFNFKLLLTSCLLFLLLLIPSFYQIFIQLDASFLFSDIVKVSKYLMPLLSFFFFREYIKHQEPTEIKKLFNLVWFSYIVLVVNILMKYVGFGYPMYASGDIGSKGLFYAGNETSALLIILTSILAYEMFFKKKGWQFYLFTIFSLFIGLSIGSKTGTLGVLLLLVLIPLKRPSIKSNTEEFKKLGYKVFGFIPIMAFGTWIALKHTSGYGRISYYWEKLDVFTFILSHRNFFCADSYSIYQSKYNFIERIIGVGQTKYELLNNFKIIEIDIADIFFAFGFIGLFLFVFLIFNLMSQSWKLSKLKEHPYTNFVFLMVFVLLGISSIAGHVFSSGMSAVFIGLLFSLMYIKENVVLKK